MREAGRTLLISAVIIIAVCFLPLYTSAQRKGEKFTAAEIVSRHLDSIGTPESRAAAKTRLANGKAEMREIVRGSGGLQGSAVFASDTRRIKVAIEFPGAPNYRGEQFVFDGAKVRVAQTAPGARSPLGTFLFQHPEMLREGLLGGVALTSWSLLDVPGRGATIKYQGLKKIDGRDLHQLTYAPKKGGSNLEIRLYFEPDTFHHVKTVYTLSVGAGIGRDVGEHPDETRYFLEENFSDFRTVDGLTLPRRWSIRYEVQPSRTAVTEWTVNLESVQHNAEL